MPFRGWPVRRPAGKSLASNYEKDVKRFITLTRRRYGEYDRRCDGNRTCIVRPRSTEADDATDRGSGQDRRRRSVDRSDAESRRGALPGGALPVRPEFRRGHAVRLDAQPLSRLHTRLPLLLRAALPHAIRAWRRRRIRLGHLREDESDRGPAAGTAEAVMDW